MRIALAIFVVASLLPHVAAASPFEKGQFQGRIGYSADGNFNDADDWAASPVALAILAECGLKDRLVHFDYNCILPKTDPEWEKTHAESVLGAAERYGYDRGMFHDCRRNLEAAVASIARAIDESSADNPFYYIVAGPMEVPYLGIQKSDPAKRRFVYCLSHSRWNDGYSSNEKHVGLFTHTKRSVIEQDVNWVQIRDQNRLLSTSPYGRPAQDQQWKPYLWMRDSADAKVRYLWERILVSTRPDPSDAGLAYFLATGDEAADPEKLHRVLDGHVKPAPLASRRQIRLEAENFRHLHGCRVEDRNDAKASHRLQVSFTRPSGSIRTQFAEPYAPSRARCDVEIRYFDEAGQDAQFALAINSKRQGAPWKAAGKAAGWQSQVIHDVEICAGDQIAIEAEGAPARLDYVQFNFEADAKPASSLTIGVAQIALAADLATNRDKLRRFIVEARQHGCRAVVFPETALTSRVGATQAELDAAVEAVRRCAAEQGMYVILCVKYHRDERDRPFERLLVVDPRGEIVQTYNKLWSDARFNEPPGLFAIDGIPCAATLCADRWIRSVEELPVMAGAQILFECSNNYGNEWIDDLGWYWYVPRALRNGVYVVFTNTARENQAEEGKTGHGHSAVIAPDGELLCAAGEESDRLLITKLDLARATRQPAELRRQHPLFKPFWETGLALLSGKTVESRPFNGSVGSEKKLKMAAAQMACSSRQDDNLTQMLELIQTAATEHAQIVVFPELAVSGASERDILAADAANLQAALTKLSQAAAQAKLAVVFGMPWLENGRRENCAFVLDARGKLLTRYAQIVVDRPQLFSAGTSTQAMWYEIEGVPGVVTIGGEDLWSELAELAALRGAQLHLHLAYACDTNAAASLRRKQLWANLASFRTFTATVNAADNGHLPAPSEPASGGSALWEDYHRARLRDAGGYFPYSALRLAEAGGKQQIIYAEQATQKVNPQFRLLTGKTDPRMTPWYEAGARIMGGPRPLSAVKADPVTPRQPR